MTPSPAQRKLYALIAEIGLSRGERHDLAEMVLRRDVQSFADLTDPEVTRLLDVLTGWGYVTALLTSRVQVAS